MPAYLVGALTRADRPGVFAAFTKALLRLAGNVGECRATRLRDMSAVQMVVTVPDQIGPDKIKFALTRAIVGLDLMRLWIEPLPGPAPAPPRRCYAITATGPDRPGILNAFSECLADLGLPLLDLFSQPLPADDGSDDRQVGLSITLSVPEGLSPDDLRSALGAVADDYGLDLSIDPTVFV
jgi:glycine cleavage system regulatory protein